MNLGAVPPTSVLLLWFPQAAPLSSRARWRRGWRGGALAGTEAGTRSGQPKGHEVRGDREALTWKREGGRGLRFPWRTARIFGNGGDVGGECALINRVGKYGLVFPCELLLSAMLVCP